jgi:hypothetical protein
VLVDGLLVECDVFGFQANEVADKLDSVNGALNGPASACPQRACLRERFARAPVPATDNSPPEQVPGARAWYYGGPQGGGAANAQ